ncbi:type I-E CRISPR-associated protein Cse1/CasA [Thermus thermophilus]|uniref:CRISPR type I-E/ECOLI-associated protein CasA/Cse1 n=1 Tax=Thermus thermophilus JL-18 TaxID=798128 RepID=H9ZUD2_THETH|nr:type I-E CRISPR-associated protein Cse1/CasA [Thermus thermophilus]AFH39942.1 CRISPR type I-E/ECOLI-associated protein CasA/Cse1 [Thermus thermophilus JL-18]
MRSLAKFNLIDEPWIPVLKGGRVVEVGIGEALLRAHEFTRIETPSPLEEAALHRLLLAVLHRALRGPRRLEDVLDWWREGGFPQDPIRDYLNRFRDRFFLFHPEAPFLQVADLPEENPLPWSKLLPELASGNNPTLFDHTTEENLPKATYAQAARALLVHQAFAPGGLLRRYGVGSAKDAPVARPALFLPTGRNLLETLLLNLVPYNPGEDAPIWEIPPLRFGDLEGGKTAWPLSGRTRVYTWPARGVRFLDEGNGVRFMGYGPGVEPLEAPHRDPMVAQRLDAKGNLLVLRLSEERSFWRDFSAMLPRQGGKVAATLEHAENLQGELEESEEVRVNLRVLGQVSDQAKILDVRREVYPLPSGLLTPRAEENLEKALKMAEVLGQGLGRLALRVAQAVVGKRDHKELADFARSLPLERLYWHVLDGAFPGFFARVEEEASLDLWREALRGAALEAWKATRRFLGTGARHLKALAQGEQEFGRLLGELGEEVRT